MGIPVLQLIRILSASIAPVIVISGVGLLLLSMTNRYSRVIDRARESIKDLDASNDETRRHLLVEQVKITYRRARILRLAIILSSASILCVTVTVLSRFAGQYENLVDRRWGMGVGQAVSPSEARPVPLRGTTARTGESPVPQVFDAALSSRRTTLASMLGGDHTLSRKTERTI